jgi:hypothetical protein
MLRLVAGGRNYLLTNTLNQNRNTTILLNDPFITSKIRCSSKNQYNFSTSTTNTEKLKTDESKPQEYRDNIT